jgi:hypothetical protein
MTEAQELQEALEDLLDYAKAHPKIMRSFFDLARATMELLADKDQKSKLMGYDEFLSFAREMLVASYRIAKEPRE